MQTKNTYGSAWYAAHPELVLGTESMEGSMHPGGDYTLTAASDREGRDGGRARADPACNVP